MTDVSRRTNPREWDGGADVGHEHKWQLQQRLYFVKNGFAVKITNQAIPQAHIRHNQCGLTVPKWVKSHKSNNNIAINITMNYI